MDLGIAGRRAMLIGLGRGMHDACSSALEAEGVRVGEHGEPDIVVAGWSEPAGKSLLQVGSAEELHRAWDAVETSLGIYRASIAAMEARGWGRFVWVGPSSAKSLDSHDDDLGAVTSLAMLAAHKLVTSEAGASHLTANAVLYGGDVADADVASAVCFLCSEGAAYMSGVAITVDGGAGSAMFP